MPDWLPASVDANALTWLCLTAFVAGLVRGFAGFGTAMIFLPVAGQFLSPFEAITALIVKDLIGPLPALPRALRDGHPADVLRLAAGLAVAMPLGVLMLSLAPPEAFRYAVSTVALVLLVLLIGGVRYRGVLTRPMIYLTGALGGVLGGAVGVPGPPVILLYMASTLPPRTIRANNTVYLLLADVALLALFVAFGEFVWGAVVLGLVLAVPYLAGNLGGTAMFRLRPAAERTYRMVAYAIIAASAIHGLPLLD